MRENHALSKVFYSVITSKVNEVLSEYFYICTVAILLDDIRYKLPKHVAQDKYIHIVSSVVFVQIIKSDVK